MTPGGQNPRLRETLRRHDWPEFTSLAEEGAQSYILP